MFNLKAGNGKVILTSERYKSKRSAETGITSVKKNAKKDANFDRKKAKSGAPYFTLKAANKEVIGRSEMYGSTTARETGIRSVKNNAGKAKTDDQT